MSGPPITAGWRFSFPPGLPKVSGMPPPARDAILLPTLEDCRPESLRGTPGFFRVAQSQDGQWWLVDPLGHAFFSKGVAGVNRAGRAGPGVSTGSVYMDTALALHGADVRGFMRGAIQRLRAWHFNTLGAWTEPALSDQGMYYTEVLDLGQCGPVIHSFGVRAPDVFDPAWREAVQARARDRCDSHRGSRELIGYYLDHDLAWAQPLLADAAQDHGAPERPTLLQVCLSLEPAWRVYHAAWEFVLATRRGDLARLAQDWQVELPNKETLRQMTLAERALTSPGYRRDQGMFAREFARRYFAMGAAAVRTHDPDHLILGCRFAGHPGEAVLSECVYPNVDVVSLQPIGLPWEKAAQVVHAARGMPVLLTDLNWSAETFRRGLAGRESRSLGTTLERTFRCARTAVRRVCAQRGVVGYEWGAWADAEGEVPPFGRGLVHLDDREAREHTELWTELNARAERLRARGRR